MAPGVSHVPPRGSHAALSASVTGAGCSLHPARCSGGHGSTAVYYLAGGRRIFFYYSSFLFLLKAQKLVMIYLLAEGARAAGSRKSAVGQESIWSRATARGRCQQRDAVPGGWDSPGVTGCCGVTRVAQGPCFCKLGSRPCLSQLFPVGTAVPSGDPGQGLVSRREL